MSEALRRRMPLSQVAQFRFSEGLNQIRRENGKRRVVIQANVRGRDVGLFVNEAQAKGVQVTLPAGAYLQWGGQFQNLRAASQRLAIVVPLCFAAIFGLLYMALGGFARGRGASGGPAKASAHPLGSAHARGPFSWQVGLALAGLVFIANAKSLGHLLGVGISAGHAESHELTMHRQGDE